MRQKEGLRENKILKLEDRQNSPLSQLVRPRIGDGWGNEKFGERLRPSTGNSSD